MADRPQHAGKAYEGRGITVYYDVQRCVHFAECVRGLPEVFDARKRPWIQPEHADVERIAEVVRRCPSGALHYELEDGPPEEPESPIRISAVADGPLTVRGDLRIELSDREMTETRAALCRCGQTASQPFCDDACKRTGWTSD